MVPHGSEVSIALLAANGEIPIGLRLGTDDADAAHAVLTAARATVHQDVLRLDFATPMFTFADLTTISLYSSRRDPGPPAQTSLSPAADRPLHDRPSAAPVGP